MINISYSDNIFNRYITPETSVAYYPSAGFYDRRIFSYPFDVLILSDYVDSQSINGNWQGHIFNQGDKIKSSFARHKLRITQFLEFEIGSNLSYAVFEKNQKKFLYFFEDNNNTVERLLSARVLLDGLITINDGCREGGNYECINNSDWKNKLYHNFKPDTIFVTDHFNDNYFKPIRITCNEPHRVREKISKLENLYSDYIF